MRITVFFLAALSGMLIVVQAQSGGINWSGILRCLSNAGGYRPNRDTFCAARQMLAGYTEMRRANCRNCDKYFHCQANYNAVSRCGRSRSARETARKISDCREYSQGGGPDSVADQEANRFGRNLGNCGDRYLRRVGCAYNPSTRTCRR
ncbi:serum amyloid A-5 protein-like [Ornithodoros turicata]|uniref:serum amyloid A-5 protein-like n=1 Tax=Ornithodoros turicata TaxID=34597 RepID=UPI0031388149